MANFTIHVGDRYAGNTTGLAQYYGAQTATAFEVIDSSGILIEVNFGSGFTYRVSGFFNGGTVSSAYFFSSGGTLTHSLTGLNLDVSTRNSLLQVGTSGYDYWAYALRGNDSILGSGGDDNLYGSKGNDTINGGSGVDVLTFHGFAQGVTVNLLAERATTSFGTSSVVNVEDIEGSAYSDVLTGNGSNNTVQGFGGNDTINGSSGTDTASYLDATFAVTVNLSTGSVTGGSGSDSLTSIERVVGSRFSDTLIGSSENETFQGGFGSDFIDGGGGRDTVQFGNVGSGVVVNLATGTSSGGAGADTYLRIEDVIGSIFGDTLTGNSGVNLLQGGSGNDTIAGGAGNDILSGQAGADILTGGSGGDRFDFDTIAHTGTTLATRDRITDFVRSQGDRIDLSTIDANASASGNQAFSFIGASAFSGNSAGKLRYDAAADILYGSTDADTAPEFSILLNNLLGMQAADFIL